jgi:OPA family glycerol-3-phosphate transporter-like MFS transporter 1/2
MVAQYAFAFGFFKLINYVLFFWLPYFLGKAFDPVTANLIAALYSVGMMPGGIIVGYVSDLFGGRRATVISVFMGVLIVFLGIFSQYSEKLPATALLVMLGCMGILVGGYEYC